MPFLGWLDSTAAGAPRWLTKGAGGDWLRAVAVTFDAVTETVRQGVKLRFPSFASPDALDQARNRTDSGNDRVLASK